MPSANQQPIHTDNLNVEHLDQISIQPGGMGLKGLIAQVGNASAMALLAVVLFMTLLQVRAMHEEGITTLKVILDGQVKQQEGVIRENTSAIHELAKEIRLIREERKAGSH